MYSADFGAVGAHHAERGQEFFLLVEIGRAQPTIGEIGGFDHRHDNLPKVRAAGAAARRICCLARAVGSKPGFA